MVNLTQIQGRGIRPAIGRPETVDFFSYGAEWVPLAAAAGQVPREIQIQADSDFLIVAAVRDVRDAGAVTLVAAPPVTVRIFDSGSGRDVVNIAQPIENLFGTGQLPTYWPKAKLIQASSTLRVELTNLDGANPFDVRVSFLGYKVFKTF